ncbi:unnamed protein product [Mucor fragilis]
MVLLFEHFSMRFSAALLFLLPLYNSLAAARSIHKRDLCNDSNVGYFITPNTITGDQAFGYCQSLGGRLADIDTHNLLALTALVNNCLGPSSRIRVQTWDTNTFGTASLAMFTGPVAGYGTVNIASNGEALYALCAMMHDDAMAFPAEDANRVPQTLPQQSQE